MIWMIQYNYIKNINDHFNYTNSHIYNNDLQIGKSLINRQNILFNNNDGLNIQDYKYFNYLQPYQYKLNIPYEGINLYSYSYNDC